VSMGERSLRREPCILGSAHDWLQLPTRAQVPAFDYAVILGSAVCGRIIADDLNLLLQVLAPRRSHVAAVVECTVPAVRPPVVFRFPNETQAWRHRDDLVAILRLAYTCVLCGWTGYVLAVPVACPIGR
jgi:hypothetical protein